MPGPVVKNILLVEDSPDDAAFFRRAAHEAQISAPILVLPSGSEALRYLAGQGAYADRSQHPFPSVMFLNLVLPDLDSFAVLEQARKQFDRKRLLIIVLTGAVETARLRKAYLFGADSFMTKPPRPDDLRQIVTGFPSYF